MDVHFAGRQVRLRNTPPTSRDPRLHTTVLTVTIPRREREWEEQEECIRVVFRCQRGGLEQLSSSGWYICPLELLASAAARLRLPCLHADLIITLSLP